MPDQVPRLRARQPWNTLTRRKAAWSIAWLPVMVSLAACSGDRADTPETESGSPEPEGVSPASPGTGSAGGYVVVDIEETGSIRGTVRYLGDLPSPRTVAVSENTATCGTSRLIQMVEIGPDGGLRNAVISLTDIARGAGFEGTDTMATLDQRGCDFIPHILLAHAGDSVRVLNSDPLTHNVHTQSFENRSVNRTQPPDLHEINIAFLNADRVKVQCDLHPWMTAWIAVVDHPYHDITDSTGEFDISSVPPGSYTIEVWHEGLGTQRQGVTVTANQTVSVDFDLTGQG